MVELLPTSTSPGRWSVVGGPLARLPRRLVLQRTATATAMHVIDNFPHERSWDGQDKRSL